ncbi:hypothetical protein CTI12_AA343190 [Artemisia annua]|uniref:RNA-directed DNA polymerase n=1 Tax=Artemisia annua TaxID=35608 RepID=A0A2U1LFA7_ARTAN|nr:hypothetical protein CTI12_AA343190 [Artemisia annua]
MAPTTRITGSSNSSSFVFDDETRRYFGEQIAQMVGDAMQDMNTRMNQMQTQITELGLQNNQMGNGQGGGAMQHSRVAKIDFPKFSGEDVRDGCLDVNNCSCLIMWLKLRRMFKPQTLADAYCLTNLQEATLEAVKKKNMSAYTGNNTRYGTHSGSNNYSKPLLPLPNTANTTMRPRSNTQMGGTNKRLTQKEYAKKRENNLCFYCDEKYVLGHKCSGQLYSLVVMPEIDVDETECLEDGEQLEDNGVKELQAPQISIHALTGTTNFQTMRVIGKVGKHDIHILVDCGSTHNFLDKGIAKKLGCNVKPTCPLAMTVANGSNLITDSECKDFKWQFGSIPFSTDVMLLPLGGYEMVLSIQWLATLGDMICNFSELKMEFMYMGKRVLLSGTKKSNLEWLGHKNAENAVRQPAQAQLHSMMLCVNPELEATCMKVDSEASAIDPKLQLVIDQYEDVFAIPTELPPHREQHREHDQRIPLLEGAVPVNIRPYKHPPTQKDAIESMVKELLEAGVIKKSHSPFSSPIVMVKKKDNSWRMCVDYRQLNKQTVKDKFPIPIIEELIDELHGSKVFTKLDLRSGYHQIRMHEEDIVKTALRTHEGHYEFLVMPFGPSMEAHVHHVETVLETMRCHKLYANLSKCVFGTGQVEYLGHMISAEGVATEPDKIKAMANWPMPANIKQLRGFLGLTGYYRRFIKAYATISKPLTQLLKKNAFSWNGDAQTAFEQLKQAMILIAEIGGVLLKEGHPIGFLSKTLSPKHQLLSTYEKEFLAIVQALEKWRGYLLDRHFKIKTDHFSLKYLLMTTPAQVKWLPKLMGFDYEIQYKKGVENVTADALSRLHQGELLTMRKMRKQVKQWIKECDICQRCKPDLAAYPCLLQPLPIPDLIWSSISMDFVEGLPKSQGKNVIFVVVDRLSKYAHFMALTHPFTATTVAQVFLDNIYKLHGLPNTIVSDRDKIFLSTFWKELFKLLQVKLHMSSAYHPQSDGQTKVVNRCLECYLRCMCGEQPKQWAKWLSLAEWWYNTNHHSSINTTPFEVVYGHKPPLHVPYVGGDRIVEVVDRTLTAREATIDKLKFHLKRAQDRMKSHADKGRTDRTYEVGDWVYVKLQPHRQVTMRKDKYSKLSPRYYGPFLVQHKCRGAVTQQGDLPACDAEGVMLVEPVAVLDRRLAKKGNGATVFVLIQWANGSKEDATWEPIEEIQRRNVTVTQSNAFLPMDLLRLPFILFKFLRNQVGKTLMPPIAESNGLANTFRRQLKTMVEGIGSQRI